MLTSRNARVDMFLCCGCDHKCPRRKPAGDMLREALAHYRAAPADTPFVGDQADDLKAAFHAGCKCVSSACWSAPGLAVSPGLTLGRFSIRA
jgi:D-glycero-D-manno-heptose 1,7-bisphosphate phosphatase